jgi:hypothetical protein
MAVITDDLYNILTTLKPSQRVEYLQLNEYNNIDEILRKYCEHKNTIRAVAIKERKTLNTQAVRINQQEEGYIADYPLTNEIIPVNKTEAANNITDKSIENLALSGINISSNIKPSQADEEGLSLQTTSKTNKPAYEYLINKYNDCYNIFINSYAVIEIDTLTKTIKIYDDYEGVNKEIFNINM